MAKDPVCRVDVDECLAADQSEYRGKVYFFCSPVCKTRFDRDQARFLEGRPAEQAPRRKSAA